MEDIIRVLQDAMDIEIARHEIEQVLSDMHLSREVAEDTHKVWTLI